MDFTFYGANCVRLGSKQLSILFDPSPGKLAADVRLYSQAPAPASDKSFPIDGPGEYEIKGAFIKGVPARPHVDEAGLSTIYSVQVDGIRVALLGNIAPKLSDQQLEEMDQVDVLVLPVGGHGLTLDATAAVEIISQIEPKIVIPTHFDDGKTTFEMPQDKLDVFLNEIGSTPEPLAKFKIAPADLPEETTLVILEKQD